MGRTAFLIINQSGHPVYHDASREQVAQSVSLQIHAIWDQMRTNMGQPSESPCFRSVAIGSQVRPTHRALAPSCKQRGEAAPSISLLLRQLCMSVPRTKQRCAPQRGLHARPNLTRACRGCICRWPSCEKAPRFPMPPGSVCSDCIDFSSSVGRVCSPPQADGRWVPGAGAVRPPRRQ